MAISILPKTKSWGMFKGRSQEARGPVNIVPRSQAWPSMLWNSLCWKMEKRVSQERGGGLGPFVWAPSPGVLQHCLFSLCLWSTATPCRACPPSPSSSVGPISHCLPLPMSSTYVFTPGSLDCVFGWAQGWSVSQLTSGLLWAITRGRAEGEQEVRDPQASRNIGWGAFPWERPLQCNWWCPHVLCLFRTIVTACWGLRPLTCPPPAGSLCGFWAMSSSRSITLSSMWPTIMWALPSPLRLVQGRCLHLPATSPRTLQLP